MREATETLIALLKPDVGMDAMIAAQLKRAGIATPTPPMSQPLTLVSLLEQLRRAIADTEKIQQSINEKWRSGHKRDPSLRRRRLTAKEWLAGVALPLSFERHFRLPAGRSRGKAGKPSGPMVRFISTTMQELGLTYADESIVKAYSLRAPLRAQRRRGDDILTEIRRQT
jgi:hypothetical protein